MAEIHKLPPSPIIVGERTQQLDMLMHIQEFSSMVVLVTGEPLVGKTALLHAAQAQLSIHHQVISSSAQELSTDEQLLMMLSQQLGCGASWREIEQQMSHFHEQGDSLVLLIDDAHLLKQDLLTVLVSRSIVEHGWHLVLAGDDELRENAHAVEQDLQGSNLFHLIHLSPLTEDDSNHFIQSYFSRKGEAALNISQKSMHQLWLLSKGNVGRLVDLLDGQLENQASKRAQFPLAHVAAVLLIGSALIFSYLYKDEQSYVDSSDPIAELLHEKQEARNSIGESTKVISTPASREMVESPTTANIESGSLSKAEDNSPKALDSVVEAQIAQTQIGESKQSNKDQPDTERLEGGTVEELHPKPNKQVEVVSKADSNGPSAPRHPLLLAPSQSYILQLVGVRNEKNAKAVANRLSRELKTDKVTFYQTVYKDAPWYVVVYGPIDNKGAAQQTAKSLSSALKSEPWIRPVAKIQEDIRKNTP